LQRTLGNQAVQRLQAKLAVGLPGDRYEQEADRIADQVMRRPEGEVAGVFTSGEKLQKKCAPCAGGAGPCSRCAAEENLSFQRRATDPASPSAAPAIVHEVLRSPGQPLDPATRAFMEPRFGHNFGHVRVHADAQAAASAEAVKALAYTAGEHMVFGAGQYRPETGAGRRLLAHELSHTIQQGDGREPIVQRAMKFEFQTKNVITTNKGRKLGRKFGKFLHQGKTGARLETDTGGVAEFETGGWERKWNELKDRIQEMVDIVTEINKDPKAFPFSEEKRLLKEGRLKKGEKLEVDVTDASFTAKIQSSEGLALTQYESFLREHEKPKFVDPVVKKAQTILDDARQADKTITSTTNTDNLRGFLQVIVNYITRAQEVVSHADRVSPVKAKFRLMHRTQFSSVFSALLSPDEQRLFKQIVKGDAIPKEFGLSATAPLFNGGYWGHSGGMMAFFDGGEIVALATEDQQNIYDCTTKKMTKGKETKEIDKRQCKKKVPASEITIRGWLDSIVSKKKDLLSPPHGGSVAMGGEGEVKTRGKHKGLVRFETRGTEGHTQTQPASKWVDYVEEVFVEAATCRPRSGKAGLEYTGSKKFDPKKCP
jgi:hypothetical protein